MKVALICFIIFFYVPEIHSQIDTSFQKIYKTLIKPPKDCREASELSYKKTFVKNKTDSVYVIDNCEQELNKLKIEIEKQIENFKSNMSSFKRPEEDNPPPDFSGFPSDESRIVREVRKSERASGKTDSLVTKFKSVLLRNIDSLNAAMKKTLNSDSSTRMINADKFLADVSTLYSSYYLQIQSQVKIIDNAVFGFDIKEKIYFPFESFKLLQCQHSLIKAALFLNNITKETSKIGKKFFLQSNFEY